MRPRAKILAIDDHPVNTSIIAEILGEEHDVFVAGSGEKGLEIARRIEPEIILLDIMMPGMDGYEVCRRVRADPTLCRTKIIMVTARALTAERLRGYEVGADDYLTKPFDMDELRSKVRVFLRLKSVEEVERLKSNVFQLLSHESRTPLNGILAPSEMLLADETMAATERRELYEFILTSARQLLSFFDKTAKFCAITADTWEFDWRPVSLSEVARVAIGNVREKAAARDVVIVEESVGDATVTTDAVELGDVITGLLDNAIRASQPRSTVTVRVHSSDDSGSVSVADQGCGLDPASLSRVFDACNVADLTHHSQGHGLSLAIARQFLRRHDGRITAESVLGVGSTFSIELPVAGLVREGAEPARGS